LRMGSAERESVSKNCLYNYTMCTRTKFPKHLQESVRVASPLFASPQRGVVSRARHNLHRSRLQAPKPPLRDPTSFSSAFFSFCFPYFGKRKKIATLKTATGSAGTKKLCLSPAG
jgi:hypothetical protein